MRAVLIQLNGDKGERQEFPHLPVRIGRSSSNDFILTGDNRRASSRHAEIVADARGLFFIHDLDSTNGTFLNGMRITQAQINIGDIIEFGLGGPKFRFEIADAAAPEINNISTPKYNSPPASDHSIDPPSRDPRLRSSADSLKPITASEKEFGRNTVQMMLNQAVQRSSRRWKWLLGGAFFAIAAIISLVIYQQQHQQRANDKPDKTTATSPPRGFAEVAARNQHAMVLIYNRFELYDKNGKLIQEQISNGSGFVANERGEIVTNRHVIEPWAFKISSGQQRGLAGKEGVTGKIKQLGVFFADDALDAEHMFPVKDYELSKEADVAILRIKPPENLVAVEAINTNMESLRQGDEIVVLAFPLGLELNELTQDRKAKSSLTRGIISKIPDNQKQIQLDVAAYEGSSGGPIFNSAGQVIGLLTSGPNDTLNFGTPIRFATKLLKSKL